MPYDSDLAERVFELLEGRDGLLERNMFGGISYLCFGNMSVGILGKELVVRVAKEENDAVLAEAHTRPMDFTGKPMRGWVYIDEEGSADPVVRKQWVERGWAYASSLPKKAKYAEAEAKAKQRSARNRKPKGRK